MSWTSSYQSVLRQLSIGSLYDEVHKLENSIKHLRRSNEELRLHCSTEKDDASWILPIIKENEQLIEKQSEQVKFVRQEISERAVESDHTEGTMLNKEYAVGRTNGSGGRLTDGEDDNRGQMEVDGHNNGLHL